MSNDKNGAEVIKSAESNFVNSHDVHWFARHGHLTKRRQAILSTEKVKDHSGLINVKKNAWIRGLIFSSPVYLKGLLVNIVLIKFHFF